jgi:hypothetical protein
MLHGQGMLSGFVFLDADNDGTRDSSEVGVPGVVINLSQSGATQSEERSVITSDDGSYTFEELEAGTYQLSKRQNAVTMDGSESTPAAGAKAGDDFFSNLVLADDQVQIDNNFAERELRPEFINISWFFASGPTQQGVFRETIAISEENLGNIELADSIRDGASEPPPPPPQVNRAPTANSQTVSVQSGTGAPITLTGEDGDPDVAQTLSFIVASLPTNGTLRDSASSPVSISVALPSPSVTYTPNTGFTGSDSFTFEVRDDGGTTNGGQNTSSRATVSLTVSTTNQPFGPVTPGPFDDPSLRGTRTDLVSGAPAIAQTHVTTEVDYTGHSNPPTYGPHHGVVRADDETFITPRPTGVYSTEQPDEDLIHNLEHGHVWISYNPSQISATDKAALEQLVRDGGNDTGVILTPRSANTSTISLASWAHLQQLNSFDAAAVRSFILTNRGHSPEGFIPSGQKGTTAASESLDDDLPHGQSTNEPFDPVTPGSVDDPSLLGTRTDTVSGAPAVSQAHVTTAVDYTGHSNPPSYGPHHAVFRDGTNFITPRPSGVYTTEQPDEDLVHNLEHGHVWISYHPTLLNSTDRAALERLVRDGGTDTGVVLTPRSRNTSAIVLTSWTRQLALNSFNATTIRNFVNTNRGHSPEGFIPSGERLANADSLNDGLPHTA